MPLPIPLPIRVLVIEDDSVARKAICLSIEAEPALTIVAVFDRLQPALAWMHTGAVDVLLTDLGLPDGSGIELILACRKMHPACDIMVLTASAEEADVLASIEAGACGYLLKGALEHTIASALLALRKGGTPMSPAVARMLLERIRHRKLRGDSAVHGNGPVVLTKREAVILDLIARGVTYVNIANMLAVSVGTVQTHIKSIYGKLAVHSRCEAVFEAQRQGLLKPTHESLAEGNQI